MSVVPSGVEQMSMLADDDDGGVGSGAEADVAGSCESLSAP